MLTITNNYASKDLTRRFPEMISIERSLSLRAKSTNPVLSDTLMSARSIFFIEQNDTTMGSSLSKLEGCESWLCRDSIH